MADVVPSGFSNEPFGHWLGAFRWASDTLTYSFPVNGTFFSYQPDNGFFALTEPQKQMVRTALQDVSSLTGLSFTEVTETFSNEATLRFTHEIGLDGGYAYLPDADETGGDAFFGTLSNITARGGVDFLIFQHEIGHTLGLDHGHEFPEFESSEFNSQEFTLMTYTDYIDDDNLDSFDSGDIDWAQSFMQLDIAALQFLYGANYANTGEIWSGDTIYTFNPDTGEMSMNGVGQGAPAGNRIFRTIWDGHGDDIYDLSNYTNELQIDLAPGAFSTFSTMQLADLNRFDDNPRFLADGNVANARLVDGNINALIENAIGGSAGDDISGNQVANTLEGQAGDDTLNGLSGADILLGGTGADKLLAGLGDDLAKGARGKDVLIGAKGDDTLIGGGGADKIKAGSGADQIIGGQGLDRLFGGAGKDVFIYKNATDAIVSERLETIRDFQLGKDKIDFYQAGGGFELDISTTGEFIENTGSITLTEQGNNTLIRVDLDGDSTADMQLLVLNVTGLSSDDFIS